MAPAARDELEKLSAAVVTKIELPAIMGSIASGIGFIAQNPAVMKAGWLHAKLAVVLLLALLSHAEMFNARKIVKARAANANEDEIEARKKRHEMFGGVGSLLVHAHSAPIRRRDVGCACAPRGLHALQRRG